MPLPAEVVQIGIDVVVHYALDGAGALARRAKPTLTRLLRSRFGGDDGKLIDGPDVTTAQERLRAFGVKVDERISASAATELTDIRLDELFRRPEITSALYEAFESAMDIADDLAQKTLADLVIARLTASDESGWGPAARIAIRRVRDLIPRQVRILAVVELLQVEPLSDQGSASADGVEECNVYRQWLLEKSRLFMSLPMHGNDFAQLSGLGRIDYDMSRGFLEGTYTPTLLGPMRRQCPQLAEDPELQPIAERIRAFHHADQRNAIPALAAATLTPAGELIAVNALKEELGLTVVLTG